MTDSVQILAVGTDLDLSTPDSVSRGAEGPFEVRRVADPSDRLDAHDGDRPATDCIVCAHDPPETDGLSVLDAVREDYPDLPFVLCLDAGPDVDAAEAVERGVTDVVRCRDGADRRRVIANRVRNAVERRRSERRAARLEHETAVTREVDRELRRADAATATRSETETRACEALTDALPCRAAAVVGVDADTGSVEPRTWVGPGEPCFEAAAVAVDDAAAGGAGTEPARNPFGRVLQDGAVAVEADLGTSGASERWREAAVERGFRSLAAVPLAYGDAEYGLLVVFSDRPGAFDGPDRDLLADLGNDVAHALRTRELSVYERLLDESPIGITLSDPSREDNPLVYMNDGFEELTGYAPETALGRNCRFLQGAETRADSAAKLRAAVDAAEPVTVELRNYRADGTRFWNRLSVVPLCDDDGQVQYFAGFQQDVTDRKREERDRKRTIRRVTDAIVKLDSEWRFTMVDERAEQIYDLRETTLLGEQFWDVFDWGLGTRFEEEYRRVMETREPTTFEAYYGDERYPELVGWYKVDVYPESDGGLALYFRDVTDRKERERELERYETIIENLPVGVFRTTLDGSFTDVNPAFVDLVDAASKETVLASDANELDAYPDDRPEFREALTSGETVRDQEVKLRTFADEDIWVSTTLSLTESDGERYIEGISRDVTERMERERELRQKEERYRNLVENSPAPISLFDEDGTIVWGNDALLELLGLDGYADLEGRSVFEFVHPDERAAAEAELALVIGKGTTVGPTGFKLRRDDGDVRYAQVKTTAGWYRGERVGQAVVLDVTELRETERELRQNEQRYRTVVEMSPDPILVHKDGEIVYSNGAMVDLVDGDGREELLDTHINRYLDPGEHADATETARMTQRGEVSPTRYERTVLTLDGERRYIETTSRPIAYEDEPAVLTVIKDVTDRYRYERMLTTLHDRTRAMTRAGDRAAVVDVAIETTAELLGLEGTVVYEFDGDRTLEPLAWSPSESDSTTGRDADAPAGEGTESPLWEVFVDGEGRLVEDRDEVAGLHPELEFDAALVLPVGNHGVLVTGSPDEVSLTTAQRQIAELITEHLEAALDRAERESDIEERDEQLHRQNEALEQLNRLNEIIRDINQALVRSSTRGEIEESVCDRLAATDQYAIAWIGDRDAGDAAVTPNRWSGATPEFVEHMATSETGTPLQELVAGAFDEETVQVARNVLEDPDWERHRRDALNQGYRAVAAVPIVRATGVESVLVVHATGDDIFDDRERAVLTELGQTIGYALRNVERVDALRTDERTEVELTVPDDRLFTNRLTADLEGDVEFVGAIPGEDGTHRAFLRLGGVPAETVERRLADVEGVTDVRSLAREDTSGLYQMTISTPAFVDTLRDHDARLRSLTADSGTTTLSVVLHGDASVRPFVEALQATYPGTELLARREDVGPVETRETFRDRILDQLTDKQLDALRTAQYGGFYEWPRATTSEALAETRDIAASTFQYHLRAAERKLVSAVLDPL